MNVTIFEPSGSTDPIICDFCGMALDGTEPAESLIPETANGKYGKMVVAHSRCAVRSERKMHYVGSVSVINASDKTNALRRGRSSS